MTDWASREWDRWQVVWRDTLAAPAPVRVAAPSEMERRVVRERRLAWLYSAGDIAASVVFVMIGVYGLARSHEMPVVVWAISLFGFTAVVLAFSIWNRRDALVFSTSATTDFVAALRLRLARRERVPRFLGWFVAAEIAAGTAIHAVWYPGALGRAARLYALVVLLVAWWTRRYRRRLCRARVQLDALTSELDFPAEPP